MRGPFRSLLLGLLTLSGCTVSEQDEVQLGAEYAAHINSTMPIVSDPDVADYMNQLGQQMASRTARANLKWHFAIVNSSEINAFALPGGYIYVNRGLIERTERLDELAGAIGHEIGHIVERHSVRQIEKSQKTNIGITIFCSVTSVCDNKLAQAVIGIGSSAYMARYSRLDEAQADSEAVQNVIRVGISPEGVVTLFEKLLKERKASPGTVTQWFLDHPLEESRIAATRQTIALYLPEKSENLQRDSPEFQAFKTRLATLPRPRKPDSTLHRE